LVGQKLGEKRLTVSQERRLRGGRLQRSTPSQKGGNNQLEIRGEGEKGRDRFYSEGAIAGRGDKGGK